jgi:peptide/nickel transport system substrate-binding protein
LDNLKVRQAIAAAIDVDEIVQFAGKDIADKGCSIIPNGYLGEDCSSGGYIYDVERAKRLLTEAGYPSGITIKAVVSNVVAQKPIMEVVQAQLAKAGITLQMEVVDHATYQSKIRKDQSAVVFYGAARFPSADYWLSEFYDSSAAIGSKGAMSNFAHCDVADVPIRKARITTDLVTQKDLWKQAQSLIHEDVCGIPLFGLKQVWVHGDNVNYGYGLKGSLNLQPPVTEITSISGKN